MVGYGFFQPSTLGMRSQAHALNTIGINVANVNTGGYKATETRFETVLSKTIDQQTSDIGGVKPKNYQIIDKQGIIQSTSRDLDLSIVGNGFFQVSPSLTSTTEIFYTRDGSFEIGTTEETSSVTADDGNTITINNGYLTDKNGYYVLGWSPESDGTFSSTATLAPMRIDAFAFVDQSTATSSSELRLNLPSTTEIGDDALRYAIDAVDSAGNKRTVNLNFHAGVTENTWTVIPDADNVTALAISGNAFSYTTNATTPSPGTRAVFTKNVSGNDTIAIETNAAAGASAVPVRGAFFGLKVGDTITVADSSDGAASNNDGTYTIGAISSDWSQITLSGSPLTGSFTDAVGDGSPASFSSSRTVPDITFGANGNLTAPTTPLTLTATWSDASTSSFTIDLANTTQFAGDFTPFAYSHNGLASASMSRVQFDQTGHVIGSFEDGTQRKIYKIPLAMFSNPNGLEMKNGMVFDETAESGTPRTVAADESGVATFNAFAVELSNVDLASEFSRMILVQNAYNSNATVFRTVDEMTITAHDLKA